MKQLMGNNLKKGSSEDGGDWHHDRIELKSGHNIISWTVMSYRLDAFYNNDVITISHIDVYGINLLKMLHTTLNEEFHEDCPVNLIKCVSISVSISKRNEMLTKIRLCKPGFGHEVISFYLPVLNKFLRLI